MRQVEFAHGPQASTPLQAQAPGAPEVRKLEIPLCVANLSIQIEDLSQSLRVLEARLESAGVLSPLSSAADERDEVKASQTPLGQAIDGEACRVYSATLAIRVLTMRLEA